MSELTLFTDTFSISPYAMSVFVALEEKGVPYHLVKVGLHRSEHQAPTYRARTGRVPSIAHGDFVLAESSAIAEYLEEVFPPPHYPRLFPADLKERATAREIMAWIRSDFGPIREERATTSIFVQPAHTALSEQAKAAQRRLVAGIAPLIHPERSTIFEHWCLADTDVALMLQRLNLNGDELPRALRDFAEANWKRPSVKKWLSHPRDDYTPY